MNINGTTIDPERLYTPDEWAAIKGVSPKTLAKNRSLLIGEGFVKLGRAVFYRGSDIIEAVNAGHQPTGKEARKLRDKEKAA